jgi:SpoVK/Ycf46/Vps4 family AAA+-type ATPase
MTLADPLSALDGLIGLEEVRRRLTDLRNLLELEQESQRRGYPRQPASLHAVLMGSPGTGKTEVAKAIADMYRQVGVLTGPLIHCSAAADLLAAYVGQTAIKTRQKIEEAMGGVLLIDEAYLLAGERTFGGEVIAELSRCIIEDRGKLAVLLAGYPEPMQEFFRRSPSLARRIAHWINMPEYTDDQLVEILLVMAQRSGEAVADDARPIIREKLATHRRNCAARRLAFRFARDAENLLEKARMAQAQRLVGRPIRAITDEELSTLTAADFYAAELGLPQASE